MQIVFIIILIATTVLMIKTKSRFSDDISSEEPLNKNEKAIIWLLCILNPVVAGAILYYGWRKKLPVKAKQANSISLWAFFIALILVFASIFMVSLLGPIYEPDDAKVYIHERLTPEDSQKLSEEDILEIIEAEFRYTQDTGIFDDNGIKYIQSEGSKNGKNYSAEDINKIIDIEESYMKSIGIEVQESN